MRLRIWIALPVFTLFIASLSAQTKPPFQLDSGITYTADISYGPHERNVFDLFLPPSRKPAPLVIYIHGGGFTTGDKSKAWSSPAEQRFIQTLLGTGTAFASVNYRFLQTNEENELGSVLRSMGDVAYCLQYIRYNAGKLGLDKERIVLMGGSAGAGTSLWISVHDDMADKEAADPVRRESTRVLGAILSEPQATYDITRWKDDVFTAYDPTPYFDERFDHILGVYGTVEEIKKNTALTDTRREADMLEWMSPDDPELYIQCGSRLNDFANMVHHPDHSMAILKNGEANGITVRAVIDGYGIDTTEGENVFRFILRKLRER